MESKNNIEDKVDDSNSILIHKKEEPSNRIIIDSQISINPNPESIKLNLKEKNKKDNKINKKLAKAIKILLFHEGEADQIFSESPSKNMWLYHFGNGDEDDQKNIKEYFNGKYGDCKVFMFPGISYGFLEFNDLETARKVMEVENQALQEKIKNSKQANLDQSDKSKFKKKSEKMKSTLAPVSASHDLKFSTGPRTVFVFYSKILLSQVKENNNSTFPIAKYSVNISGLYIIDNFITEEEEIKMVDEIDKQEWIKLTNRRVQHYGYEFLYGANNVNKNNKIGDLPYFCDGVNVKIKNKLERFKKVENDNGTILFNLENTVNFNNDSNDKEIIENNFFKLHGNFDQLTINDYFPGEGIPPHVDSHSPFEDLFCSLSLLSGVVMTFTSLDNQQHHLYLKPRSMIFFTGEARYTWQHSISLRKLDRVDDDIFFRKRRISLTFRKIRKGECKCPYTQLCDSQKNNSSTVTSLGEFKLLTDAKSEGLTTEIEKKHVYDVYEKIAPHFSHTRYKPWPKVADYLNNLAPGSFNLDVGCGNGKYLNVNDQIFSFGTDRSFNLINICKEKSQNNQLFVADSLSLPFRSNTCDSVISIAVVHHFSNVELRLKAINELIRVLKIDGTLLIYVWAMEQEEKKFTQQDNFVPWHLQDTYENENKLQTLGPQIIKEEKKNATVYHRYYHVFVKGELENLLEKIENISIIDSYYDHANWCCIVKKQF